MIECKNICLSFSETPLFKDLNILIDDGENVCLSGTSGKGKTTLLKILQGYVMPDTGQIRIDNKILSPETIKQIRDSIVWIPQNINLPVNNAIELLKLMNIHSFKDRVINYINNLGLEEDILFKNFNIISGGQKQRIIISICLSLDKKILLMDEPTSSLDKKSISYLIDVIRSLKGKTIVSASHNQQWINSTDKTIIL
jgi:polar amino acid transport system ATP-binding protein/putative ABC transport system ATP-binding protein